MMKTFEVVKKSRKHFEDSCAAFDDVYEFKDGTIMNSKEFSDYYKKNETENHHIVIL